MLYKQMTSTNKCQALVLYRFSNKWLWNIA